MRGSVHNKKKRENLMSPKAIFLYTLSINIFLQIPFLFSGEIYHCADEKGTIPFTDDVSKIHEQYIDQAEKIKVREETIKEVEKLKNWRRDLTE
jgi:hypothetical protein